MGKINIAELLKDCPKGMELYSPIFGVVYFEQVKDTGHATLIEVNTSSSSRQQFYPDGKYNTYYSDSECLLFPSKDQRDWSKFQTPFKDGDVISNDAFIEIFHKFDEGHMYYHCWYNTKYNNFKAKIDFGIGDVKEYVYATEEEKEKLFKAIKDNGYKWNAETKTLEKLKKEKFDISTLIPFESKVLVRDYDHTYWRVSFFGFFDKDECIYDTVRGAYKQCIPYDGNQHLLNKTDDCDEFYKTWE